MLIRSIINKPYLNLKKKKKKPISSQNHAQRNRVNKTRYDELSFVAKNLGGNLPKKQFTIRKRSLRCSTTPLKLDSTIPVDELTAKTFSASESLNSLIYERSTYNHN